jgi:hypothetical protein
MMSTVTDEGLGYWGPDADGDWVVDVLGKDLAFTVADEEKARDILAAFYRKSGHTALLREIEVLRSALERLDHNFDLLLARKPVRDVAETKAEVNAALEYRAELGPKR